MASEIINQLELLYKELEGWKRLKRIGVNASVDTDKIQFMQDKIEHSSKYIHELGIICVNKTDCVN